MWMRLILRIYNALWYVVLPGVMFFLWYKGRKLAAYRKRWKERFGLERTYQEVDVWIHAVSLGEVVAATSMIQACLEKGYRVLVTTMTPTGSEHVLRLWGQKVAHQYCPYDFSFAIHRFLLDRKPKLLIIFETELWPGILSTCYAKKIPILLVNARISDRSYPQYLRTRVFWQYMFGFFQGIYVQSDQDKARFLSLGARSNTLHMAGNLKFNHTPVPEKIQQWQRFLKQHSQKRLLVFGSTHPGEEVLCIEAFHQLSKEFSDVMAIIVPRHPERFDSVFKLLKAQCPGLRVARYSNRTLEQEMDVLLVDTMGELSSLYSIAYCAFVGGSLVPIGGHNILEPIVYQVPVLAGPYMQNQKDLVRILTLHQAMIGVQSGQDLAEKIAEILRDTKARQQMIENGQAMMKQYQNCLSICMQGVKEVLN